MCRVPLQLILHGLQPSRCKHGRDGAQRTDEEANSYSVWSVSLMMLIRVGVMGEFGALAGLQNAEYNCGNDCSYKLRDRRVDIKNAEVNARRLSCRCVRVVRVKVTAAHICHLYRGAR